MSHSAHGYCPDCAIRDAHVESLQADCATLTRDLAACREQLAEATTRADDAEESMRMELAENLELFTLVGLRTEADFGHDTGTAALHRKVREIMAHYTALHRAASAIIESWAGKARDAHEEAGRIRRTIKAPTDAEMRCLVRAEVWEQCAKVLRALLTEPAGGSEEKPSGK